MEDWVFYNEFVHNFKTIRFLSVGLCPRSRYLVNSLPWLGLVWPELNLYRPFFIPLSRPIKAT